MNDYWKPRLKTKRLPHGFEKYDPDKHLGLVPESPEQYFYPIETLTKIFDEAFDQLDSGISLRLVSEWFNATATEKGFPVISHTGIRDVYDKARPDHPVKFKLPANSKGRRRTREERSAYIKKNKLAQDRKRLTMTQKRIERQEAELSGFIAEQKATQEELKKPLVTLDYTLEGLEEIKEELEPVFVPNPGPQTQFFAASEMEVLYGGSAGGGKSYALIADPMRFFDNPNFNGLILRRTNDELRELIWKSQELYRQIWPKAVFHQQKSSWTFPSGSHLWFTYLERDEDVMRYQGQAFTYIGFDELTQHPTQFAWDYLRSRLRTTDPNLPLYMRATTNPGGPGHGWVKRMFVDPAIPGTSFCATDIDTGEELRYPKGHSKEGQPLFFRKFIQARLSDNPYLYNDGRYEASLMSLQENQRRRLLEGDWSVADGAAFSEFRTSIHTCEPFEIPDHWLRFRSCDYGYSERQATAVHWYAVEPHTGILYVYRELYINKHTGIELARRVLELEKGEKIAYGVLDSSVWANRGQNGPSIAEEMIQNGCRWRMSDRTPGSRVNSKNRLHELLRVDKVNGKPGIIFFNTCRHIIATLPIIPSDKDSDDIDQKYPDDHAYDSIRYGIQTRPQNASDWFSKPQIVQPYRPASLRFGY
jgi:hypothetical protein